ncbi:hypothetical protein GGQ87_001865 [Brevundimonas alba]|uniref:Argininosuccinate lyase n=1 Tax=Brevundimonas alba TaxID=74314 RepID=A0A7X5YKJ4_9CAUL|nr:hypothetical protein [Brevundimonas alba]NJC41607.1 hypothetical protein [Brevundimonas alba]
MLNVLARRTMVAALMTAATLGSMGFQSRDGQDRRVLIINQTGVTMTHFYASNSGQDNWEEDILGSEVLPSGRSIRINIDDGTGACVYDFRARFVDGDVLNRYRINVCEITEYRYTAN